MKYWTIFRKSDRVYMEMGRVKLPHVPYKADSSYYHKLTMQSYAKDARNYKIFIGVFVICALAVVYGLWQLQSWALIGGYAGTFVTDALYRYMDRRSDAYRDYLAALRSLAKSMRPHNINSDYPWSEY